MVHCTGDFRIIAADPSAHCIPIENDLSTLCLLEVSLVPVLNNSNHLTSIIHTSTFSHPSPTHRPSPLLPMMIITSILTFTSITNTDLFVHHQHSDLHMYFQYSDLPVHHQHWPSHIFPILWPTCPSPTLLSLTFKCIANTLTYPDIPCFLFTHISSTISFIACHIESNFTSNLQYPDLCTNSQDDLILLQPLYLELLTNPRTLSFFCNPRYQTVTHKLPVSWPRIHFSCEANIDTLAKCSQPWQGSKSIDISSSNLIIC